MLLLVQKQGVLGILNIAHWKIVGPPKPEGGGLIHANEADAPPG